MGRGQPTLLARKIGGLNCVKLPLILPTLLHGAVVVVLLGLDGEVMLCDSVVGVVVLRQRITRSVC